MRRNQIRSLKQRVEALERQLRFEKVKAQGQQLLVTDNSVRDAVRYIGAYLDQDGVQLRCRPVGELYVLSAEWIRNPYLRAANRPLEPPEDLRTVQVTIDKTIEKWSLQDFDAFMAAAILDCVRRLSGRPSVANSSIGSIFTGDAKTNSAVPISDRADRHISFED